MIKTASWDISLFRMKTSFAFISLFVQINPHDVTVKKSFNVRKCKLNITIKYYSERTTS